MDKSSQQVTAGAHVNMHADGEDGRTTMHAMRCDAMHVCYTLVPLFMRNHTIAVGQEGNELPYLLCAIIRLQSDRRGTNFLWARYLIPCDPITVHIKQTPFNVIQYQCKGIAPGNCRTKQHVVRVMRCRPTHFFLL